MSTKYELRCMECDSTKLLGERSNHAGEEAALLLQMAFPLAQLGRAFQSRGGSGFVERLYGLDVLPLLSLAAWFVDHDGHDVRLFSEYGEEWGKCGERIACPGNCGTWRHCALTPKHEGDHQP